MKAIVCSPHGVHWQEVPTPTITLPTQVRIRVGLAGICRTDLYVAQGKMPYRGDQIVLGHEFCGEIVEVGRDITDLQVGMQVTAHPLCLGDQGEWEMLGVDLPGAFAQQIVVPAHLVTPVPEGLTQQQAAYAEPVAAALAILLAPLPQDEGTRGLLWGTGRIAELTARVLRAAGHTRFGQLHDLSELQALPPGSFDWVVETQATAQSIALLTRALRPQGLLVLKSRPAEPVAIDLQAWVRKALRVHAADYGSYTQALEWMATGRLEVQDLLGPVHAPEDHAQVFAHLSTHEDLKHFFRF